MEDRLQRLEAKVARLNRAAVWTHRLNRLTRAFALLSAGAALIELAKMAARGEMAHISPGQWDSPMDITIHAIMWVVVAWSAGRINDVFTTLVDVIGELSETV